MTARSMPLLESSFWVATALGAQYLPPAALRAVQLRRLRRMLAYCRAEVPFYRDLWAKARVDVDRVRSLDDLWRLPIPSRRAIEEEPERIVARRSLPLFRAGTAHIRRSGGSSGGPRLEVHCDERSWRRLDGFYFRALAALGYGPFTPIAYYWSAPFEERPHGRLGLMPKVHVPAHLDEEAQLAILERHPGVFWYYHPTSLFPLAKRFGERLRAARPACVISHAELLPRSMRAEIERALGAPVYDEYGTSEFNRMAWQCRERSGYHVDADSIVLEILDDDGRPAKPGEVGRAVVTGLVNRMMPLVRYELGDLLVASDRRCACGRTLPMIESVEGRVKDVLVLPDGGTRTPRELLEPYASVDGLEQYALTLEGPRRVTLEYVTSRDAASVEAELARRFARACPGMEATFARVPSLPKAPTGKRPMIRGARAPEPRGTRPLFVE